MYEYNEETGGICSLREIEQHDCLTCPKKGMCDFVCEERKKLMEMSDKNDISNRSGECTECILPNREQNI